MNRQFLHMSGSTLKLIAIFTMLLDHIGAVLIEPLMAVQPQWISVYYFLRYCGRLAFPIFCFLLVEGFWHTGNVKKYALRLGIFALISEIPFDLAFHDSIVYTESQNVFFTLFIGLLTIWGLSFVDKIFAAAPLRQILCRIFVLILGMLTAWILKTDYSYFGVMIIAILYEQYHHRLLASVSCALILLAMNPIEITAFLCIPLLQLYNGQRGLQLKYIFYVFYPLHLLVLYGIVHCFL